MLSDYLTQQVTYEKVIASNAYGEKAYQTTTIGCRKVDKNKLVRNKLGEVVTSSTCYYLLQCVDLNDRLDGKAIIAIEVMCGLDNVIEGYKVYVA